MNVNRLFTTCALVCAVVIGGWRVPTLASAAPRPEVGTTITVTTATDDTTVDANCSLREALQAANTDTAVDACPAGNGADTILLGAHTYSVTAGELDVSTAVTVEGTASPGIETTINGHQPGCAGLCHPTFHVQAGGHLTMSALMFENGGVVIRNDGQLNLALAQFLGDPNSQLCGGSSYSRVTALDNRGTATVSQVLIQYSPGAIANAASASLAMDHLSMNHNGSCGYVGASITNNGSMRLRDSEFGSDLYFLGDSMSIRNFGPLVIDHVKFDHNSGSLTLEVLRNESSGTVTITRSAFDENQVLPIFNWGTLTMRQSRITSNEARWEHGTLVPGAVLNSGGRLNITDTTIDHNVGVNGGAVDNFNLDLSAASATLVDDTITDNATVFAPPRNTGETTTPLPSGGIMNGAVMMIRDTTITANQVRGFHDSRYHAGGVVTMPNGYTALSNTIVSGNTAQAPVVAQDCFGAIHSLGYNLIGDLTGCSVGKITTGNRYGLSPDLHPLGPFGGPTMTAPPYWNSPATDTGNPAPPNNNDATTCTVHDQRGVNRPRDGNGDGLARCDIGAYER